MPGDRRDEDHLEYGRLAGHVVRRRDRARGQEPARPEEPASRRRAGCLAVCGRRRRRAAATHEVQIVLNELESAVAGLKSATKGDTVVICADDTAARLPPHHGGVRANGGAAIADPGEFSVEEG